MAQRPVKPSSRGFDSHPFLQKTAVRLGPPETASPEDRAARGALTAGLPRLSKEDSMTTTALVLTIVVLLVVIILIGEGN